MPAKTTIKLSWLVLPDEIRHIWYLLHNSTREFCVWGKKLCNYFSTELTKTVISSCTAPLTEFFSLRLSIILLSTYLMADSFFVKNR